MTLAEFKATVRDQYFMLLIDEEAALAAIPDLLPDSLEERRALLAGLRELVTVTGPLPEEGAARLERVAGRFELDRPATPPRQLLEQKMEPLPAGRGSGRRGTAAASHPRPSDVIGEA